MRPILILVLSEKRYTYTADNAKFHGVETFGVLQQAR